MTIYFNPKAVSKVYEYFEDELHQHQHLYKLYPLKDRVIADFTDDIDEQVYYMSFSENGASNYLWKSLDEAMLGTLLGLCPINDSRILNMLDTLIK